MSRSFQADTGLCTPRMIPWRDWDEWYRVKALLFSPDPSLRSQGVQHVAVWRSRERIPHAVETTSQLVEVRLNDVGAAAGGGLAFHNGRRSEEELRLVYSAVVVRAVNGLTGNEQKTAHAAPVASVAREIGLETWIVDIRHEAAHKQLPGIVALRLAADSLEDYLWRRYWGPQAEHLEFIWGAFDQLISRYKATSDNFSLPSCSSPPNPTSHPSKKKRRSSPAAASSGSTSSPTGKSAAATAAGGAVVAPGSAYSSEAPSGALADEDFSFKSPDTPLGDDAPAGSKPAQGVVDLAMEIAALEIVVSATPTAVSWALISLLADGGTKGGGRGIAGVGGTKPRGQGHLIPRSRDKYPTPGTPGVDSRLLGRRLTSRWATLLNMFQAKWRGFGAALVVRLVEALLDNALSPPVDAVHPNGGSSNGGYGGGGLERQAIFIEIWVQHLLSRRWHLRASDARIRDALREAAVDAGLSPTFSQEQEAAWGGNESDWADQPAPMSVLHAAYFPVRELLDRCRRSLDALPTSPQPCPAKQRPACDDGVVGNGEASLSPAPPATPSADADGAAADQAKDKDHHGNRAQWARAGIAAVCRALAAAIPGEDELSAADVSLDARGGRDCINAPVAAVGGPAAEVQSPPSSRQRGQPCHEVGGRLGGEHDEATRAPCAISTHGNSGDGGGDVAATAPGPATAPLPTMMDLDDLERLLGGDCASSIATCEGNTSMRGDVQETGSIGVARGAEDVDGDAGSAWELVEAWTPCAIGTLPGWSGGRL